MLFRSEVRNDESVPIDPYYSTQYLATAFSSELPHIKAALSSKYPSLGSNYTIDTGTFYHYGDWYSTTFYNAAPNPGDGVDIYGVILHKVGETWDITGTPNLVFNYAANPSIPKDIVDSTNHLVNDY